MLELKSKNLFIKNGVGSHGVISKILEFYDLIGKNILLLHYKDSLISSWVKFNKQEFTTSTLKHILSEHLFRLDLIVVDTATKGILDIEENYRTIRQITDLPVIFLTDYPRHDLDMKNFNTAYILSKTTSTTAGFTRGRLSDSLEDHLIESIKEEWKSNLKELKIQYIRDKNLLDLLGEDE